MAPYVERTVELGATTSSASTRGQVNAFGSVEFVRAHPTTDERSPADELEEIPTGAPVTSRVIATIRSLDGSPVNPIDIGHVVVGIRANDLFRATITDEDLWTSETGPILTQLDPADRTFVLLWARGYRLASASAGATPDGFLKLDPSFEPGKPIALDLVVEREGLPILKPTLVSATGTRAELPPFRE